MKKVVFLLACILTVSSGFSQERKRVHQANHMTPEQRTTLAVKKMTLALDLDKNQAKKVAALFTKMSKKRIAKVQQVRKEGMMKRDKTMKLKKAAKKRKLSKEDIGKMRKVRKKRGSSFDAQNKALDRKIAMQSEMKKILTKDQYTTYKKMHKHRMKTAKQRVKKHKKEIRAKRSR